MFSKVWSFFQHFITTPPSKIFFSNAIVGASFGRSTITRKNSFSQSGVSISVWAISYPKSSDLIQYLRVFKTNLCTFVKYF